VQLRTVKKGSKVRVALLGCGRIARLAHLRVLSEHPRTEVVSVADQDPRVADYVALNAPGAHFFTATSELLEKTKPDAVVIALPTVSHRDAAVAAFRAKSAVYLEKPIAATLEDAHAIRDAWATSARIGRIGFNLRFGALHLELKDAIARGEIGSPVAVRSAWTARFPEEATWRLSAPLGGGAMLELASHHVDLLRFVFEAEVKSVSAEAWSNRGDDQAANISLTLSNGLHAGMFVSYGSVEEDRFEVYGTEGKLSINRYDSLILERSGPFAKGGLATATKRLVSEVRAMKYGIEKRKAPGQEPSFAASIGAFIDAVSDGKSGKPDIDDGVRALEVIDAARRSAVAESRVVHL
jgi:myo-inositol 2-dehydrogenase/D-chiro-inositol 1-dehydrogenase